MRFRSIVLATLLITAATVAKAQLPEPDKSPLDVSYCPYGYPVLKFQSKTAAAQKPFARVLYSRPQVKGRAIFGYEVPFNQIWRLGANESTELELFKPATIGGKKIPKGRYSLYCIPAANSWTIILNKDTDSWGAFSYNPAFDVLRTSIPLLRLDNPVEYFTLYFDSANSLVITWDCNKALLPIKF